MVINIPYYEDNTRVSNSSLGWFLQGGPKYFKDMLDGKGEKLNLPQLDLGTMIHEYLLQPEEFWKDYKLADFKIPSTKLQENFCKDYLGSLQLIEDDKLIEAYEKNYSTTRFTKDTILSKAKASKEEFSDYISYLSSKEDKKLITPMDLNMLKKIKSNVENHIAAKALLEDTAGCECHNEFHINWEYKVGDVIIPCKSLLDRFKVDHVNKKITLIDIKTTSHLWSFKDSVDKFDYFRQIAYYILALMWYFKDLDIDVDDYDVEAYIVAIENSKGYDVRVFNMFNEQELMDRARLIKSIFSDLSFHFSSNLWEHTRKYYEENGIEEL